MKTTVINCCVCYMLCGIMDASRWKSDTWNVPGIKIPSVGPFFFSTRHVNCSQMWSVMPCLMEPRQPDSDPYRRRMAQVLAHIERKETRKVSRLPLFLSLIAAKGHMDVFNTCCCFGLSPKALPFSLIWKPELWRPPACGPGEDLGFFSPSLSFSLSFSASPLSLSLYLSL